MPIARSTAFWAFMERWRVPDADALELVEFAGKIGKPGNRPRFRFSPKQRRIVTSQWEIDAAMETIGHDAGWLRKRIRAGPFMGRSPLDHIEMSGEDAITDVLRLLARDGLKASLAKGKPELGRV